MKRLLIAIFLLFPFSCFGVTLPFSTTYDCAEWSAADGWNTNCDGLLRSLDATFGGYYEQITSAANYPGGGGGRGQRHWVGASAETTGGIKLEFSGQTHIWISWMMRYSSGFSSNFVDFKALYLYTSAGTGNGYSQPEGTWYRMFGGGSPVAAQQCTNCYFGYTLYPTGTSDGSWHHHEMEIDIPNGVGRMWIDGQKIIEYSGISWGNLTNVGMIRIGSNIKSVSNGSIAYVDYDDFAVSTTGWIDPPTSSAIDGECGPNDGGTFDALTSGDADNCANNVSATSFTYTGTGWTWGCPGLNGGTPTGATDCTADETPATPVNGACGSNDGGEFAELLSSDPNNCVANNTVFSFTEDGYNDRTWGCAGINGGTPTAADACSASWPAPVIGACGTNNGGTFDTLSNFDLNNCATGTIFSFAGAGPWTWGCAGLYGGASTTDTACSADITTPPDPPGEGEELFSESFETPFGDGIRGWYDGLLGGTIVAGGQSGNCMQWAWTAGNTKPANGDSIRRVFTPSDELYIEYYVKFASNWQGSQVTYHPHMIYLLSDADPLYYPPLANNYLNTYLEFVSDVGSPYEIRPHIAVQDSKNNNYSNGSLPNNLTATTEERSVNHCNTPSSLVGADGEECWSDDGGATYYSSNKYIASTVDVSKDTWHKVGVYLKMNTISGGIGQFDGIMQEWIDDVLVIDNDGMLFRTGENPNLKWNQFIFAPYIGVAGGSPITQMMWIDELVVRTAVTPIDPPSNFRQHFSGSSGGFVNSSGQHLSGQLQ